jgi:hypothetical protein
MNKTLKKIYHEVGLRNNLKDKEIQEIVESQYKFIKEKIINIDFHNVQNEEEFDNLKTNFILKYLGKLHTNYPTLTKVQKQSKATIKSNKQRWEKKK